MAAYLFLFIFAYSCVAERLPPDLKAERVSIAVLSSQLQRIRVAPHASEGAIALNEILGSPSDNNSSTEAPVAAAQDDSTRELGLQDGDFKVDINKETGKTLGLAFSSVNGVLMVTLVSHGGAFRVWNNNHPEHPVQVGDEIVMVNGYRTEHQIRDEFARKQALSIVFHHMALADRVVDLNATMLDQSESVRARVEAAGALANLSRHSNVRAVEPAAKGLVEALLDPDESVVAQVAWALGCFVMKGGNLDAVMRAVPHLELMLCWDESGKAARALGDMVIRGLDVKQIVSAVPTLVRLLRYEKWQVRKEAAQLLGRFVFKGGDAELVEPAVPQLVLLLQDKYVLVREQASRALGFIFSVGKVTMVEPALLAVVELLRDKSDSVRQQAARALAGTPRRFADLVLPALLHTLQRDAAAAVLATAASSTLLMNKEDIRRFVPKLMSMVGKARWYRGELQLARVLASTGAYGGLPVLDKLMWLERYLPPDYIEQVRSHRHVMQKAMDYKCSVSFRRQTGASYIKVGSMAVEPASGVMLLSHKDGTDAHRCANQGVCPLGRRQGLTTVGGPTGTINELSKCPFALQALPNGSMCERGYNESSRGCTKCTRGYGRTPTDPFSCQRCGTPLMNWAIWFVPPLGVFLFSMYNAETAATCSSEAARLANDLWKILGAFLPAAGVVMNLLKSTDAYRALKKEDMGGKKMLGLTDGVSQYGDVTPFLSLDCLLTDGKGPAEVHQLLLINVALPAAVVAAVTILLVARSCVRAAFSEGAFGIKEMRADILHGLFTSSLVAGNLFLPPVAATCMQMFPCFHTQVSIDDKHDPPMFMAYLPDQDCSERWGYLPIYGPVLAIAFLAGPAYWLTLLRREKDSSQAGPLRFLTGAYRDKYRWWESWRLTKTMLVACLVRSSPTSYCQLQQLMLVLFISTVFGFSHGVYQPYKIFILNAAEAISLSVLCISMALLGMVAGDTWSLTPGFRKIVMIIIGSFLAVNVVGLVVLWVKVKFWNAYQDAQEVEQDRQDTDAESDSDAQGRRPKEDDK